MNIYSTILYSHLLCQIFQFHWIIYLYTECMFVWGGVFVFFVCLFGMNDDKNDFPSQLFLPKPRLSRCYYNHYSFGIDCIVNRKGDTDKDIQNVIRQVVWNRISEKDNHVGSKIFIYLQFCIENISYYSQW